MSSLPLTRLKARPYRRISRSGAARLSSLSARNGDGPIGPTVAKRRQYNRFLHVCPQEIDGGRPGRGADIPIRETVRAAGRCDWDCTAGHSTRSTWGT